MKKTALFSTMILMLAVTVIKAQSYEDIRNKMLLRQYKQAKEDIDKRITNTKFASKPDAFILKTAIYAALSMDSAVAGTPEGAHLLSEAEAAFAKYREMDGAEMPLIKDLTYKEGPVNLYTALFNKGYKDYQASKWDSSFQTFKKVMEISDILAARQMLNSPVDTTVLILTAYTGENANHRDEAYNYYKRLADAKVAGNGNEFIYRFMVLYSFQKNNMEDFEKYRALGKEYYPNSEYFGYDKTDFAVGLSENFEAKVKAMEEVLAKDPSDYKANVTLAQVLFDTLHPKEGGVPPSNADELEAKMVNALKKAGEAKPDDEIAYLVLGDHYISKADKINEARAAHVEDMKKRTKPGTQPSKTDVAKRDELDKQYGEAFELAGEPYEKAAAIMAAKPQLTASQKQQYRKVAGYLGDIYNYKRIQAKGNQADVTKFTAESKKWNDLYDSLK